MSEKFSLLKLPSPREVTPISFVRGEDSYLVACAIKHLISDSADVVRKELSSATAAEIYMELAEVSFLTPLKLVIGYNFQKFPASEKSNLLKFCEKFTGENRLILVEDFSNGRVKSTPTLKKLDAKFATLGSSIDATLSPSELLDWFSAALKRDGVAISREAIRLLSEKVAADPRSMSVELEKLKAFVGDKKQITPEDVRLLCKDNFTVQIYKLGNAIIQGDSPSALKIFNELTAKEEPSLSILFYLRSFFATIAETKDCFESCGSLGKTASILKKHSYAVTKNLENSKLINKLGYAKIAGFIADADFDCKSSIDRRVVFERMLVELSQLFA